MAGRTGNVRDVRRGAWSTTMGSKAICGAFGHSVGDQAIAVRRSAIPTTVIAGAADAPCASAKESSTWYKRCCSR